MADTFPIKVCGITRLEDAQLAVDLGAMALGFIFYEKSPRYISPENVRALLDRLKAPASLLKVGVFVNADPQTLRDYQDRSGVDILQLHGDEGIETLASVKDRRLWKAFRLQNSEQLSQLPLYAAYVEAFLFDAAVPGEYGGTGHRLADDLLSKIPREKSFILAGGLGPENWESVYKRYKPLAIDLSSSVEVRPGVKDAERLKQLFQRRG